jgi:hypothetical protein
MTDHEDYGPVLGRWWIHLAATVLLGVSGVICYSLWDNAAKSSDPKLMREAAAIALAIGLLPWVINGYRLFRLRQSLGSADLELKPKVIPIGFAGNVAYVRPLRNAEVQQIEVRLQCEEWVVKGKGKSRRENSQIVFSEVLTPIVIPMMEQILVQIPLRIPKEGPASFWAEEARIEWWLRLRLRMRGCPNTESSFQIDVFPAVLER